MQYTIASVKQAYALPRATLYVALARAGISRYDISRFSHDELVTNWLRFYGQVEVESPNAR